MRLKDHRQLQSAYRACTLVAAILAPLVLHAAQTNFQYDSLGRLSRITHADGTFTQYGYDTEGNRTARTTVGKPTLLVHRVPSPMIANAAFTVRWYTTGTSSISYVCSSPPGGFSGSDTMTGTNWLPQGTVSSPGAPPQWVGNDSNCTWTVAGPGGSTTLTETLRTLNPTAGAPTLQVTRVPNPMVAGQPFRVDWVTTGAASLAYQCTASATGFIGQGPLSTPAGHAADSAQAGWIGFPSTCRWTATATSGAVTYFDELLVTVPDAGVQRPLVQSLHPAPN